MVRIRKRNGRIEEFVESKIVSGVKKAGATADEAGRVAREVSEKVARKAEIKAEELSDFVIKSVEKVNGAAAKEFIRFREGKLKTKRRRRG